MAGRTLLTRIEIAFVQAQRVGRLATVGEDGQIYAVPICYAFDGAVFFTPLDEKPKRVGDRRLRRVRNILANPEVALLIDRYDEDWSRLGYILIRGTANLVEPMESGHGEAVGLLRDRYLQYRSMALETRPMITILPEHVTSWGSGLEEG